MNSLDGVRVIDHVWVELSDGCRLSARLWIPEGAEERPLPAILEYIPYRKNDFRAIADQGMHAYFAAHGYVSARVDLRGSGDSEGVLADEYLPLEQADGIEVIRWLAAQRWCSGKVGMIGISWGGFVGLQMAAQGPSELGAVVSVGSSVDRYGEDVHYIGGAVQASTMLYWGSNMLAYNARPSDPATVGDSWRGIWFDRMEQTPPFVEEWLRHQRRDEYWKQGSVCEDFGRITCPVYMVAGWHDSYRDSVLSYMAGGVGPKKGLIGPWGHQYPHDGSPGPSIGFLQECVRFYDRHLKGVDNGIDSEPALRLFLQEAVRPGFADGVRDGRWLGLDSWPLDQAPASAWYVSESGTLGSAATAPFSQSVTSAVVVGIGGGRFGGMSPDQSQDDGLSLAFTSAPLERDLAIVGFPKVSVDLSIDRPEGQIAARLCDVWPDGASTRITGSVLNLSHHTSHEYPEALQPGTRYHVDLRMKAIAYVVPAGHRLRLAVSAGYWPMLWPSPENFTLSLHFDGSAVLELPVFADPVAFESCPDHFSRPESAPALAHELLPVPAGLPAIGIEDRDIATGRLTFVTSSRPRDRHLRILDAGLEFGETSRDTFTIVEGVPLSAEARSDVRLWLERGTWKTRLETSSTMTATSEHFLVSNHLDAYEGHVRVFAKSWESRIPRDHT